jgi:hypothetical protein
MKCSTLRVEQYFLEELDAEAARALADHIAGCPACASALEGFRLRRDAYLAAYPFEAFPRDTDRARAAAAGAAVATAAGKRARLRDRLSRLLEPRYIPVLAALLLGLAVWPFFVSRGDAPPGVEGVRYKGEAALEFLYRRGGLVQPGDTARVYLPGDELQFAYVAGSRTHTHIHHALASVDSRGRITHYPPPSGAAPGSAEPGKVVYLPFSVTLDSSRGPELFFLVSAADPPDEHEVELWMLRLWKQGPGDLAALSRRMLRQPLPGGSVRTVLVRKQG